MDLESKFKGENSMTEEKKSCFIITPIGDENDSIVDI